MGWPVGVKDIIDTADTAHAARCCKAFKGRQPLKDAACVTARAGPRALIVGKTVTTELAAYTPAAQGSPRNLEHTPGGSSSGSAAAIAAGMVLAALGSADGGLGPIRLGRLCGLDGFKPTFGLIPRSGVLTQAHSPPPVLGVMAGRRDMVLLADALQGHDERHPASPAFEQARLARRQAGGVALVEGLHRVGQQRHILDGAAEHADGVERRRLRQHAGARNDAEGRLEAKSRRRPPAG